MKTLKALGFLLGLMLAIPLAFPAQATILFAGSEDIDFTSAPGNPYSVSTNTSTYHVGWARLGLGTVNGGATDPANTRIISPTVTPQTSMWIHAYFSTFNNAATLLNRQIFGIYSPDGVLRLIIRGTGTTSQSKLSTRNAAGTITDVATCSGSFPLLTNGPVDIFINYAVSGQFTVYFNAVQVCNYTGNVTTDAATTLNQVYFADYAGGNGDFWSEVIMSTTDTRGQGLVTCAPQANGTNMTWNGSFANVNPTTVNDASAINTGSNAQSAMFTCPALPAGTYSVPAVIQTARVTVGSSGPQNFYFMARPATGSTDYNNGATTLGITSFQNYRNIWATNPATSSAWVPADVTTGVNFGIQSQP